MRLAGEVRTAARWRRKPYVVTLHGGVFDVPQSEEDSLMSPVRHAFEWGKCLGAVFGSRRVLADADMVLCLGEGEFQKAQTILGHDRIAWLPNGVNPGRFSTGDRARFRRELGIPEKSFVVMNISRIDAQKNQALLLRAFAQWRERHPESHLVLIGPVTQPAYENGLRKLTETLGLQDRVRLLPAIQHEDSALVDAYAACDVFVLPSLHEPFGIVVLEAWCARKPVIASSVGGLRNLVRDGESGLLIDPGRADAEIELVRKLEQLADNSAWRQRLGENGWREVERRYDWQRINGELEKLYQAAERHAQERWHGVPRGARPRFSP
jgi:glycosyltransferase involved in cell wall biosynthesis